MKRLLPALMLVAACSSEPAIEMLDGPRLSALRAADPALALDPATGDVLFTWIEGDSTGYLLKIARSSDGGSSWSEPRNVTTSPDEVRPHAEASPRLVAAGGAIGLFWPRQHHVPGRRFPASEMRFSRSTDGGATWSVPVTLNDDTTSTVPAGHTFHGATAVGDSTFVVAWLDSRQVVEQSHGTEATHHEGSSYVFSTSSYDLGATWAPVNSRFWGNACPCCRVALAAEDDGVLAAWRGHFDGDVRDIVLAKLSANQEPERVHADNWSFPGCPHSGPGLTTYGGVPHITWFTGAPGRMGVYYARRGQSPVQVIGGEVLPTGHPAVAALDDGALVAVNLNEAGERRLNIAHIRGGVVARTEVADSEGADHPQLIRLGDDRALVAWTQDARVRLARVVPN